MRHRPQKRGKPRRSQQKMADYPAQIQGADTLRAYIVTIPAAGSASEMFCAQGQAIVGLIMPATWTAADIAYKACVTGRDADLQQVYDNTGQPEKTTVAAARFIAIPTSDTIF